MDMRKTTAKMKRALTLIEMIVVLMLLTMITGALAYNYKGSLDKGKEFEKREMLSRIQTVLDIAVADGEIASQADTDKWQDLVEASPLIQNPKKFIAKAQAFGIKITFSEATKSKTAEVKVKVN